ncbi:ABC-type multidrug transport system, permease component [Secundilactobacillus kimchicus JCM 15530]|uniref:ABC-type multidrug transport system, permease component n=1 Tax=Secundilactobacillus kimchicus JCM 15530 TaxID=1302272 RepID=A0A0R1HYC8_9LACO|nr:ABC transporter permease [Secundilactobacillus kimchicus]KRK48442.1 ABC-type multidrug transport system, permease component [Secundilactobacillus kimchicus JCM 15530]
MRAWSIAKRIMTEMLRDKRTLALMFVAPIIIITMLNVVFSSNATTNVNIGAVSVSQTMRDDLGDIKHVSISQYRSKTAAKKALKDDKIDSIIQKTDDGYSVTYANTDASKTTAVKMALKTAMTTSTMTTMKDKLKTASTALAKIQSQLPAAARQKMASQSTGSNQSVSAPQISNHYVYGDSDTGFFDKILPILLGFFVFFFVFLISGMALLKERTSGTLDRLLATPVKRSDIVFGYMISYGILAVFQTLVIISATIWLLGIDIVGNVFNLIVINLLLALVALAFGILVSTFARSEFQMVQFIPLIVVPQVFFSGIIPLDTMANWVKAISYIIPIKYSGDASTAIIMRGTTLTGLGLDIGILLIFLVVLTGLNIVGLRRYRKV